MNIVRMAAALTALNLVLLVGALTQDRSTGAGSNSGLLRGRVLELVDERDQVRARLNVESNGEVVFRLLDQEGAIRVKLGAATDGSGLLLANDATEPGVHLLATTAGSRIRVVDKDGRERVVAP